MGYRKIENLYKNKNILMFKECYAMEKVHGTSAHVSFCVETDELKFFSGGAKHESFLGIFDQKAIHGLFLEFCNGIPYIQSLAVYGEAYGGKMQGMSKTYGPDLRFIAFEVLVNGTTWLDVVKAEKVANRLGFDFVPYRRIETTEDAINSEMMADSEVAIRNGMGTGKMREGVILRPIIEVTIGGDCERVICKHKRPEFSEREHTPQFSNPDDVAILEEAKAIASEWCTPMRLTHVLDAFPGAEMKDLNNIIAAMVSDIYIEAKGEIVESGQCRKEIGKMTAKLFKTHLENQGKN